MSRLRRGVGRMVAGAALPMLLWGGVPSQAQAPDGGSRLFERVAGSWAGGGSANVAGSSLERIRCRANYSPAGDARLRLALRCASDSFNMQVESEVTREGDRLTGTWTETSVGISGNVSGTIGADRLHATITGLGVSADLSMTLRGDTQAVIIQSRGQITARATITLRRA